MRGTTDPGSRTEPGWYPDYGAPPGHERYWNGERWTDGQRVVPTAPRRRLPITGLPLWAGALTVLVIAAVLVGLLVTGGDDGPAPSSAPPPASTPGAAGSSSDASDDSDDSGSPSADGQRLWRVTGVADARTLELDDGAEVRLVGIDLPSGATCAATALFELSELVDGQTVTLTRRGPDKDAEGHLLRYAERDGVDVGLRLIQRGLATATDEAHARGQIYRRVDARTDSAC